MKINSNKTKSRWIAGLSIVGLAIAGALFVFFFINDQKNASVESINYDQPSSDQIKAGNDVKEQTINSSDGEDSRDPKTNAADSSPSSLSTRITTASVEDNMLYIRNDISGIYSEGSCTLSLQKSSSTVTKSAGIQALPKSSTCKGFNVPVSELSAGTWSITITVTINGQSVSDKGSVNV